MTVDGHADLIQNFVARSGTRFVVQARNGSHDSCETFYFAGANAYYLVGSCTSCPAIYLRSSIYWTFLDENS